MKKRMRLLINNPKISLTILFLFLFILLTNISFVSASQEYILKVTDEHPFFVIDNSINVTQDGNVKANEDEIKGKWVKANELNIGDELITDDGKKARITSLHDVNENIEVYNLEAKPFNDFVVRGDVVVHNSNALAEHEKALNDLLPLDKSNARINYFNEKIRTLSEEQKRVMREIHNNDKMNFFEKRTALRNAGFSDEEILLLFRTWTCGKMKLPCFTCKSGQITDRVRAKLLGVLGDDIQKSRFMKGYLDVTEMIFIDSQGRIVSLTERPDIIYDNIMNNRVGVGTNPGANGVWNGVESKVKNLGNIVIEKAAIDVALNTPPGPGQDAVLWRLLTTSLGGISYYYDAKADTIIWPANIKVKYFDGIKDLNVNDPFQRQLRTWDDSLRIGAMYDALRGRFTAFNDYPVISPITEEYLCYIRAGRGYRNVMTPQEVAQNLPDRLYYIGEADRLFFFLQHPNLHPVLRIYIVEVQDARRNFLENRRCALGFFRMLLDANRIDVDLKDNSF